jgi:hypothetical protein
MACHELLDKLEAGTPKLSTSSSQARVGWACHEQAESASNGLLLERFFSFCRGTDVHHQIVIHPHVIEPGPPW